MTWSTSGAAWIIDDMNMERVPAAFFGKDIFTLALI